MPHSRDDLRESVEALRQEVESLTKRVARLERGGGRTATASFQPAGGRAAESASGREGRAGLSVGGVAALMARGALVSLVLLLALVLRTLTDGGIVGLKVGTTLGVGYAVLLEVTGWFLYRRTNPLAPIFSVSGVLLLVAVVLEARAGFGSISTVPAYAILALAGGVMAIISRQFSVAIPVNVGTVAVLAGGIFLSFPETHFAALALFLLAVNIMAFTATHLPRARWLRIAAFAVTAAVLFLWGFKMRTSLSGGGGRQVALLVRFYAAVAVYFLFYIGAAGTAIWRRAEGDRRPFDHILPGLAAGWAYLTTLMVVDASGGEARLLGISGVGAATVLLGLAALKGRRAGTRSRGTTTFAFPAALLLALSFRDVSGESVVALAILSWAALSLAWLSNTWRSPGVRVTSYFLQSTVLGAALLLLGGDPSGGHWIVTALSMAAVGVVAFAHYRLVRSSEPPGDSGYFNRFDKADVSGVLPLLVSVGAAFFTARVLLWTVTAGSTAAFQAGETVVINAGALMLFAAAWMKADAEVKWIAVLVTVAGGAKAFLIDLFSIRGLPVVGSMLSFVLAAAAGSLVLGRWHRRVE